ncbi:MAG TPA: acyl-CoA dehydrogenase [Dehalococcoidia bacterium]|nr:acyl-CoA dehydrogenase [Dehalococcoidia bacterium]
MSISFDLTIEQESVRKEAYEFAREQIAPLIAEIDEKDDSALVLSIHKKMAQPPYSYTGIWIPKEYDGTPRSLLENCIITEELAAGGLAGIGVVIIEVLGVGVALPILIGGRQEQKRKYLPLIARGEAFGSFGLTEPGIGSDAGALTTRAVLRNNVYVLNGRKRYESFAHIADFNVIFAKTSPEKGAKGISAFIIPKETPGFRVVERVPCIGLRGHQDEEVELKDCRIPKENLIGEEGKGLKYALSTHDKTRTSVTGGFIGLARAALEEAVKFARARKAFSQPISEFQAVSFPLTEVAIAIEAARLLTYRAAWLSDRGERHTVETAAAKVFASDLLIKATNVAIDVHGGFGGTKRFPVERMLRDARIWVFAQGAPNIMKLIVMRDLFKRLEPPQSLLNQVAARG